ncbi:TetR/AcrR family transcriptional regulator [Gulosibacter molinativorax]|nr:TetR/AcrR family transcriptional regulator [Gulosibacter molinativorax]
MTTDGTSLTERRRAQTTNEIHLAAMTIFEKQGVDATTVAEIADAAGISSRTFFRYFDNKEHAGIPGQVGLRMRVEKFAPIDDSPNHVLKQIESLFESEIEFAGDLGEDSLRVAKLVAGEPALREEAAAQLQRIAKSLEAQLREHCPSLNRSTTILITNLAITTWQTSWESLGQRSIAGERVSAIDNYREHCEMLRSILR